MYIFIHMGTFNALYRTTPLYKKWLIVILFYFVNTSGICTRFKIENVL